MISLQKEFEKLLARTGVKKTPIRIRTRDFLLPYLIAPMRVENRPDYLIVGDQYHRTIAIVGIPRSIRAGFLNALMSLQGDFDVSMHIQPMPTEDVVERLNHELIKIQTDIFAMETQGEIVPPSLKIKRDDTEKTLSLVQTGEEKFFDLSFYINVRARSLDRLNELTERIVSILGQLSLFYKTCNMQMAQAMPSILPLANNELGITRNMTSSALSACFPFTSSSLQVMEGGVVIGVNDLTKIPLTVNFFDLQNSNALIIGASGSGKSFSVKTMLLRLRNSGVKLFVIDPQGEYRSMAQRLGKNVQIVDMSPGSGLSVNPFDLGNMKIEEKIHSLMALFSILSDFELTAPARSMLDTLLLEEYSKRAGGKPLLFEDIYKRLMQIAETNKKDDYPLRNVALSLALRIKPFVAGSVQSFNKPTKVDLGADFIVFDVSYFVDKMSTVAPPAMFIILDFLINKMKEDVSVRKAIVVDEAWRLLKSENISDYLLVFAKTARKYNTSLQIITQELGDLAKSDAGQAVLSNTAVKLLLRQDPAVIDELSTCLKLHSEERLRLLTAEPGHGLMLLENNRIPYYSIFMPEEERYISTKPVHVAELRKIAKKETRAQSSIGILDFERGFYKRTDLDDSQVRELLSRGFRVAKAYDLDSQVPIDYLYRPEPPEGERHTILKMQLAQIVRHYTEKVETFSSAGPDVLFVAKDGRKIALEVETGDGNPVHEKVQAGHLSGVDEFYFIVTGKELVDKYAPFGKVLTRGEAARFIHQCFI